MNRSAHPFPADGRYEVRGTLGRGGFGSVYRAFDREAGREVAIKVSHERADRTRLARFRREGEVTARLEHPGIVRVHSAGEARGYPYLVYELVEGKSLAERLPRLPLRRRIELIRDAARALGHAHAQGVVHRDVKAANILVDESGRARVADFGLAAAVDQQEALTRTGQMLGTPTHMAPEQIQGRREGIGPATDVWSLGVLLYQALTDSLPFEGDSPPELLGMILGAQVERPGQVNPNAPPGLEAVCLRALKKKPKGRHADGEAFAAELDRWLEGKEPRGAGGRGRWVAGVLGLLALSVGLSWAMAGPGVDSSGGGSVGAQSASDPVGGTGEDGSSPGPDPSAERARERAARARLRELEDLPSDDPERRAGLRRWVENNPEHPELARARRALRASQRALPQVFLRHNVEPFQREFRVHAYWLGDERVLTHGGDQVLRCWKLDAPSRPQWEASAGNPAGGVLVSPDGEQVVVVRSGGLISIDASDGAARRRPLPELGRNELRTALFAGGGRSLLIFGRGGPIFVYRWPELTFAGQAGSRRQILAAAVSPDGTRVVVAGGSTGVVSYLAGWRLPGWEEPFERRLPNPPSVVAFDPAGEYLLVGSSTGRLERLRADGSSPGEELVSPDPTHQGFSGRVAHQGAVGGLAFSADGEVLYSISRNLQFLNCRPELRAWSHPGGEHLKLRVFESSLRSLAISPDGLRLLVGTDAGIAEVLPAGRR